MSGEGSKWGALSAGTLAVISGMGLSGCGESSRTRTDGIGASSGASGSAGSSGSSGAAGAAGESSGGAAGAGASEGGAAGVGGTGSGAPGLGGTTGGVEGGSAGAAGEGVAGDGAGGDAGGEGAAGAGLEPVRVIRGDPAEDTWWDLTLQGVGLAAYEGKIVTARIGVPELPPERLGSGQVRIEGGGFSLFFLEVWEGTLYKKKRAYLDVNDNGRCDAGADFVYSDSRGTRTPDFVLTLRDPGADGATDDIRPSADPASDCAAFNATWPAE